MGLLSNTPHTRVYLYLKVRDTYILCVIERLRAHDYYVHVEPTGRMSLYYYYYFFVLRVFIVRSLSPTAVNPSLALPTWVLLAPLHQH